MIKIIMNDEEFVEFVFYQRKLLKTLENDEENVFFEGENVKN